jgi:carboxypeptidase C (cathepsin A)
MNKPALYLESYSDISKNISFDWIQECFESKNLDETEFRVQTDNLLCDVSRKRDNYDIYNYILDYDLEGSFDLECSKILRDTRQQLIEAGNVAKTYLRRWSPRKVKNNKIFEYLNIRPNDIWVFIENDIQEIIKWACNNICIAAHKLLDSHVWLWKNT